MTRRRHWDDEKRATDGEGWRRARDSSGSGIPLPPEPRTDEVTAPHELIDRPLSTSQVEIIRQSKRSGGDYATVADIVKVLDALTREKSESRERDAAYQAVIQAPHEVAAAMAKRITTIKWVVAVATLITGAGTGVTASGVLAPSKTDSTAERYRIEQAERDILRIDNELREVRMTLGRRGSIDVKSTTFPVSTKGSR